MAPLSNLPFEKLIAAKARKIILSDLSVYDTISSLAGKAGTTPNSLRRIFKTEYGETVFSFSRRIRIEEAQRLLIETPYTLQAIGELVGYEEGSNFQAAFKTVVGVPAGKWRREVIPPTPEEEL
jgi:AraC-like DNA-binding protein